MVLFKQLRLLLHGAEGVVTRLRVQSLIQLPAGQHGAHHSAAQALLQDTVGPLAVLLQLTAQLAAPLAIVHSHCIMQSLYTVDQGAVN
jgi:hypothetical protein